MSHARKKSHEVALRELIEEARRSGESRSAPRRHHLVPVFYLKQWADDGKIRMTDIDRGKSWMSNRQDLWIKIFERLVDEACFWSVVYV
jgi:hypothetical protein